VNERQKEASPEISYDAFRNFLWGIGFRTIRTHYRGVAIGLAVAISGAVFLLARYPETSRTFLTFLGGEAVVDVAKFAPRDELNAARAELRAKEEQLRAQDDVVSRQVENLTRQLGDARQELLKLEGQLRAQEGVVSGQVESLTRQSNDARQKLLGLQEPPRSASSSGLAPILRAKVTTYTSKCTRVPFGTSPAFTLEYPCNLASALEVQNTSTLYAYVLFAGLPAPKSPSVEFLFSNGRVLAGTIPSFECTATPQECEHRFSTSSVSGPTFTAVLPNGTFTHQWVVIPPGGIQNVEVKAVLEADRGTFSGLRVYALVWAAEKWPRPEDKPTPQLLAPPYEKR
jgi:hypothetical protein